MTIKISEHIENGHNMYKRTLNKIDSIMSDDYFYNTSSENLIKIGEMSRDFRAWSKVTMNILGQKCNQTEMEELTEKRDMVFYALSNEYRNDYYNRQYGASLKEYIIEGFNALLGELEAIRDSANIISETGNSVFIVHGRDDELRTAVRDYIENMGLDPIVLMDEVNEGRVLYEKFIESSNKAGYAIVLMTPDDLGGLKNQELCPRARQNVIFEYGYFVGKLGRKNVCVIMDSSVECPTDLSGIVRIDSTDWKPSLRRELKNWSQNLLI